MTKEEVIQKAEELTAKEGVKVYPFILKDDNENVIGYVKEPSRLAKYRYLDKAMNGAMSAALELLEICLLKIESDPKIYSESPEHDKFNIGAATFCASLLNISTDTLKKN